MLEYYKYIVKVSRLCAYTEPDLDTLSILMYILEVIVDCAKVVAVIVAFLTVLAFIKYLSMKWRGLLPSVAATAFVISIVSSNLEDAFGVFVLLWAKLYEMVSLLSGGVTVLFVLFAILLCCSIKRKIGVAKYASVKASKCDCKSASAEKFSISNSYLAITPVLLS